MEFKEAHALIIKNVQAGSSVRVEINNATGRVLAEDVRATINIPPFDKSAMDGFAVKAKDVKKVPVELEVISTVKAGSVCNEKVRPGCAIAIMTGAPVPKGADAVVMIEKTTLSGKDKITVNSSAGKEENICFKAEDIKKGERLLKKGTVVRAPEVATFAMMGRSKVKVYKQPEISILATGDELVPFNRPLKKGTIRNSNTPMALSFLSSLGVKGEDLGIAKDNESDLKRKVLKGLKSDILILSGGVSMGKFDLVPKIFEECGIEKIFHKVAIKPGKPLFFGKKGKTLIFGVPGNPVSALIMFRLFIKSAIMKMRGTEHIEKSLKGELSEHFTTRGDRRTYFPVKVNFIKDKYILLPVKYNGSADIHGVTKADGFMVIEKGTTTVKKGATVEFVLL